MNFWSNCLSANAQITYLLQRIADLEQARDAALADKAEYERRYLLEIQHNRRRESHLAEQLRRIAGVHDSLAHHAEPIPEDDQQRDAEYDDPSLMPFDEALVIAQQYIDQARQQGIDYDEDAKQALIATIRSRPQDYYS